MSLLHFHGTLIDNNPKNSELSVEEEEEASQLYYYRSLLVFSYAFRDWHRNQYYSRTKPHGPARFGPSTSTEFRGINCRTFQSGTGILPTPVKSCTTPISERACASFHKTPLSSGTSDSDNKTLVQATVKSTPIPINGKVRHKERVFSEGIPNASLSFSELWAGPTYSNSPPPSSLPIPKFSLRPKRTVSLDLPLSTPEIELRPFAKSAPSSPTREHAPFTRDLFLSADSATKTLRRILNLNVDELLFQFVWLTRVAPPGCNALRVDHTWPVSKGRLSGTRSDAVGSKISSWSLLSFGMEKSTSDAVCCL
ncbi:Flocculation FLO11-like protein [Quillaja saponaria]|uniref:Flocculation FLO11-like protein n=1 Tax=Quillaja saponaria TaxID=32244 RepID=A0AAD7VEL9_QUISA|nr:Flocculation FLO11-like protein [Quillaja saponaria]